MDWEYGLDVAEALHMPDIQVSSLAPKPNTNCGAKLNLLG